MWQDDRNGNWDIYMYDVSTGVEQQITSDPTDQILPAIYSNTVVWQDARNGYFFRIMSATNSGAGTSTATI